MTTARPTKGPQADDTLFGSLLAAGQRVPGNTRALAGLRYATDWVELSYDELLTDVVTVSSWLSELGVRKGDVVSLVLPNWTEAVIFTYAASRLGAVICPITTIYRQRELRFILERTECKVVVAPSVYRGFDYAEMVRDLADALPCLQHVICVGDTDTEGVLSSRNLMTKRDDQVPPAETDCNDFAMLAFTSGTTGEAKGVMQTHASMHAVIDDFVAHAGFGDRLASLVMSPFGHGTGLIWGILMPLRGSGEVVLLQTWDADQALTLSSHYSVDFTMGATPFLRDLLAAAADRVDVAFPRMFVCAGAPIPPSLVEQALTRHDTRIVCGWGMSEYPIGTSTAVGDDPLLASTSDGRPAGRAEVAIVDHTGRRVKMGQEGDLLIRGPALFSGYYKRPDLNAEAFTSDGYLRTGDRARLLDEHGHIRIHGRTKDIIIRGGENIPVVEIENELMNHPSIREVALIPLPHVRLGETACACLVLHPESETPTIADLGRFLLTRGVAKQFFPETVTVLPDLPRTPSGKVQKVVLRNEVLAHLGKGDR